MIDELSVKDHFCISSANVLLEQAYTCDNAPSTKMTAATTWLGIVTLLVIAIFMKRGFNGAIILGVLFATFISWIPNTQVSVINKHGFMLL